MSIKKVKENPIIVINNFGGKRSTKEPSCIHDWGLWDCHPDIEGKSTHLHSFGKEFPWTFDVEEKAYIIEGNIYIINIILIL
jgi:hypothetical protein